MSSSFGKGGHRQSEEDALNICTDGSMLPGPRRGGTGVIFILINGHGEKEEDAPYLLGYTGATNNQMEIRALLEALKLALGRHPPWIAIGRSLCSLTLSTSTTITRPQCSPGRRMGGRRRTAPGRQRRRLEGARRPNLHGRPGREALRDALAPGQEDRPGQCGRQACEALGRNRARQAAAARGREAQTLRGANSIAVKV